MKKLKLVYTGVVPRGKVDNRNFEIWYIRHHPLWALCAWMLIDVKIGLPSMWGNTETLGDASLDTLHDLWGLCGGGSSVPDSTRDATADC